MAYVVGPKGQIVVAKEHRDQLGVGPGWIAIQRVLGDHLEVYFLPPSHRESLKGTLAERLQAAFDRDGRTAEIARGEPVLGSGGPAGVEGGGQEELFDLGEHTEPPVDSSEASASSSEVAPVPQSQPPAPEVTLPGPSQPPSVTAGPKVKRGRGRFGWRR